MSDTALMGQVSDIEGDPVCVFRYDDHVRLVITGATSADIAPEDIRPLSYILDVASRAARAWSGNQSGTARGARARPDLAGSVAFGERLAVDGERDSDRRLAGRRDLEAIARILDELDALSGESGAGIRYAEDALAYVAGQWGYRLVSRNEDEEGGLW